MELNEKEELKLHSIPIPQRYEVIELHLSNYTKRYVRFIPRRGGWRHFNLPTAKYGLETLRSNCTLFVRIVPSKFSICNLSPQFSNQVWEAESAGPQDSFVIGDLAM